MKKTIIKILSIYALVQLLIIILYQSILWISENQKILEPLFAIILSLTCIIFSYKYLKNVQREIEKHESRPKWWDSMNPELDKIERRET